MLAADLPVPLAPPLAALSIPERMLAVITRNRLAGLATTRDDFHQAEETCDLSDAELDANIGRAKRLANRDAVRHDQPAAPVSPWEADPDYRASRIALAAGTLAGLMPTEAEAIAILRTGDRFSVRELGALWPEIITETARIAAGRLGVTP